jgi:DNA-binding GntR family transcriptional regulator
MTSSERRSSVITFGSVHDAVTDRIRARILSGQLQPGERLRQDELAAEFGVSSMPVREALRRLQAEALVEFRPCQGASVAHLSLEEFEEVFRIREELEVLACQWAAENFDQIPIDQLAQVLDELEEAESDLDIQRRLRLVHDFFFTIFRASGKNHLLRLVSNLWDLSHQYRRLFSAVPDIVPSRLEHYRSLYQACESQDPEALAESLRALYAFVRDILIPRLESGFQQHGGRER